MKRFNHTAIFLLLSAVSSMAQPVGLPTGGDNGIWQALGHCALFGALGIILVVAGFKIFDLIITKIDLEKEIAKGNIACAILSGAAILGISIIVACAIN